MKRLLLVLFTLSTFVVTGARAESDTYTVCTWNIENFGVTDRFINGKSVKEAMKPESEIKAVASILARIQPDILGVSEVLQDPDDKYIKLLQSRLKEAGLDLPNIATERGEDARIQCVVLSRFPLTNEESLASLSYDIKMKNKATGEPETVQRRISRAPIHVSVEVRPGYRLQLIQAHLKSRRPAKEFIEETDEEGEKIKGDAIIRRQEALLIKNAMNRRLEKEPGQRFLLMGDLNDLERSPALKTLIGRKDAENRCFDLWLKDWLGDWWTHFYIPDKQYERIDYMIVNKPLMDDFVPDKSYVYRRHADDPPELDHYNGSDHRPLVAVFHSTK